MLEIKMLRFEDLTDEEKENVSNNGCGKEYAEYIKAIHNGDTIFIESDAMEPEDVSFGRDLSWIFVALKLCYALGKSDAVMEVNND